MQRYKEDGYWKIGDLKIDPSTRTVHDVTGTQIMLRKKEFQLLHFLFNNINAVINRYTMLDLIWDFGSFAGSNTLEVHLSSLRKKLKILQGKLQIETIRGVGYRLVTTQ